MFNLVVNCCDYVRLLFAIQLQKIMFHRHQVKPMTREGQFEDWTDPTDEYIP